MLANTILTIALLATPNAEAAACLPGLPMADLVVCLNNKLGQMEDDLAAAESRIEDLESENADLRTYLSVDTDNDAIVIEGANLYVQSGSGFTYGTVNGLGNVIIGYDEADGYSGYGTDRTGSHNLVIGPFHNYGNYGGIVSGYANTVSGAFAAVIGSTESEAAGNGSVVVAGQDNLTSDYITAIVGGAYNTTEGRAAAIISGNENTTTGDYATIISGQSNTAGGNYATVMGALDTEVSGDHSSAISGESNLVSGEFSVQTSGDNVEVTGDYSANESGYYRSVSADYSWTAAGGSPEE